MTTKLSPAESKAVANWTAVLRTAPDTTLNRIIKMAARHFELDADDVDQQQELADALDASTPTLEKARYIVGFDPVFTDEGLVQFLTSNAAKWKIAVPGAEPARGRRTSAAEIDDLFENGPAKPKRTRKAAAEVVEPAKLTRAERRAARLTEQAPVAKRTRVQTAEPVEKVPHKGTGAALELKIAGNVARLAQAMGFRREPGERSTEMMRRAKFAVVAEPGVGIVARCRQSDVGAVTRFVRRRLANEPTLISKAVIVTRKGEVPELDDRTVQRSHLKRTTKGYRLNAVA